MKLATYNVNNVVKRLAPITTWLEREAPDIVCLQELKAENASFPSAAFRALGYGAVWEGQRSWNGVAILAKGQNPIPTQRRLPGDARDTDARYIEAAVHGVIVGNLYLPNGNPQPGPKFQHKLAWFERLLQHAAGLWATGHPVVLAGDYNVMPTELDIYNPKSSTYAKNALWQPEPRAAYARLLAQGWTDAIRTRHPDARIYTFWDYLRQARARNLGLRIDHILLSAQLAPRMTDAGVDDWVRDLPETSDHAPAWVTLET